MSRKKNIPQKLKNKKAKVKPVIINKPKKNPVVKVQKKLKENTDGENAKLASGGKKLPVLLRGMKDVLPQQGHLWRETRKVAEGIVDAYGFKYVETPILEQASLFVRTLGKGTDVVEKEMYVFDDKDDAKICLRPENTASIARAYINHGLQTLPQPVKVWYLGSMFRHDRPQAGRYREFHQFGCETIGEHDPVIDAELITVAYNFLRDLGINSMVQINSIGTITDRENYIVELVGYLRSKRSYLSEDSKKRITKNPLRVLDSKAEQDQAIIEDAPQIVDWLSEDSKKFFTQVLEYLDEAGVPYVLKPNLVRGLDYYTDTVFELYEDGVEEGSQNALGGGGRYDGLIECLGGQPTPGSGFAIGLERVIAVLQKKEQAQIQAQDPSGQGIVKKPVGVFFSHLGEQARKRALYLIEDLRRNGVTVHHNLAKAALKNQLELANKIGVTHTIILGQKEVQDGTVLIRDMESGIQEIVDQKKLKQKLVKLAEIK